MLKRYLLIFATLLYSVAMFSQEQQKFDPVKFETDLEQYVIKEAGITAAEQKNFLPIFRDMRKKQVALMESSRKNFSKKPTTEQEWADVVKAHDEHEIQMKKLAQTFHIKALKVISASKLMKVIRAEESFHRQQFRQFSGRGQGQRRGPGQGQRPGSGQGQRNGGRPQQK